ncbi:immunomodulatory protein [Cristinia sonorae]|uniref:Immunomodulatory protein n=1 Tax=Cristinia sonorae TaxID=1940300 RepID=A0A8K0XPY6_9AGAR|nr:immunomodulatory protein [Cristinia sonorae]
MRASVAALFVLGAATGALASPTTSGTATVTYSTAYDVGSTSLNTVACSNGANGLVTKGFTTLDSLPSFPYVGGVNGIVWNSPLCGTCWKLNYNGKSIVIQGIDASPGQGFNIAKQAMQDLTDGAGIFSGSVQVTYSQTDCPTTSD